MPADELREPDAGHGKAGTDDGANGRATDPRSAAESAPHEDAAKPARDEDPAETREWRDALGAVIEQRGPRRAGQLLDALIATARNAGAPITFQATTPYVNTIARDQEKPLPGDPALEERIRSYVRWNAMAMVVRANRVKPADGGELGGHLASFASLAAMIGVGMNHFWHAPHEGHDGDLVYFQGHSSPGIYSRAFLEGRLSEKQLDNFRQEVDGGGLSSYPHPKLMPDFWQFPTVSMGLGPLMAIYQARFLKYLHARGLADTLNRKVWCFCGDGEMDEPESLGAIGMAAREKLDNLIFVINCNLQRLDGPVRGNGKIIQELEGEFRGSGWNVVKLIWGAYWDPLLEKDREGILRRVMDETVDGEYQACKANDGAYVREHFFGKHPELLKMVEHMSDDEIWRLNRGGHDPHKVYAAFHSATHHRGQPTVILAKTVKGYGMGSGGQARNPAHQLKKMDLDALRVFRDRFRIPVPDDRLEEVPFCKPDEDSPEMRYLHERRAALGGYLPTRRPRADEQLQVPPLSALGSLLEPIGDGRKISTTQAFVRALGSLVKDRGIGQRIVPIVPDEARTFGMEGMFRQLGIYAPAGQKYVPVDKAELMYYREDAKGQILEEGINEAGAFASWIAAATSYSTNNRVMIPFYIYYSMFGFQRIGDLAWAAGDMQARGFLLGGTSGRTTLNGEGLQHQDGHSHILSGTIPNCISYDPTFAHEVAVIIHEGLERMVGRQENVFYYLTLLNENYPHPGYSEVQREGIVRGLYRIRQGSLESTESPRVQLLGCGVMLREALEAAELLRADWGVEADVWSATSFTELRRDGMAAERWNLLHPAEEPRTAYVTQMLEDTRGPIVATSDYMKLLAEQIRVYIPAGRRYRVLGTDGFGRSDFRSRLRAHFEVDRHFVVLAALTELAAQGDVPRDAPAQALQKYAIDADKIDPMLA